MRTKWFITKIEKKQTCWTMYLHVYRRRRNAVRVKYGDTWYYSQVYPWFPQRSWHSRNLQTAACWWDPTGCVARPGDGGWWDWAHGSSHARFPPACPGCTRHFQPPYNTSTAVWILQLWNFVTCHYELRLLNVRYMFITWKRCAEIPRPRKFIVILVRTYY